VGAAAAPWAELAFSAMTFLQFFLVAPPAAGG
jgi:hypothetical protein